MKGQVTRLQLILASAWVASFSLCLFSVIWHWVDIPTQREPFIKNAVEVFAPGLGVMLAAIFVRRKTKSRKAGVAEKPDKTSVLDVAALVVVGIYLLTFDLPVIQFLSGGIESLAEVNKLFSTIRPSVTWLVVPVIAYYFGAKPA